jgi:hypothetical protein
MMQPDPTLTAIAAMAAHLEVVKSRGGYNLLDPSNGTAIARPKPFPQSHHSELFHWSNTHERWRTFRGFGPLKLALERSHEVFREETIFHVHR